MDKRLRFPLFIDLEGKKILVVGAGVVGSRRIRELLPFGARITVVSKELSSAVAGAKGQLRSFRRSFCPEDLDEQYFFVIAATDDRAVNQQIYTLCQARGIMVNVADDQNLCDFFFPGLVKTEDIVIGVSGNGGDHGAVKKIRERIEKAL